MASPTMEKFRERWEAMQERERKLFLAFAATVVICVCLWIAFSIRSGLQEIETKNAATREALLSLAEYRASGGAKGTGQVEIPKEAVKLSRYLETIIVESGLKSPTYPQEKETTKGGYTEISFAIQMPDLSVFELKDLLEKIETKNRAVIVKELKIKRKVRGTDPQEKLDVTITVATYKEAVKKKGGGDGDDDEEAPAEAGDQAGKDEG